MWFRKKKQKVEKYIIAFCDKKDISTKFGEDRVLFDTYESAKHHIFSKVAGYGNAIKYYDGDMAKVDGAWLIIEKKVVDKDDFYNHPSTNPYHVSKIQFYNKKNC